MKIALKKILLFLPLLFVAAFIFTSCSIQDDEQYMSSLELESPYGAWILEGYATTDNKTVNKITSNSKSKPISLQLMQVDQRNGKYSGNTESNTFEGEFTIVSNRGTISFPREDFSTTKISETPTGEVFLKHLFSVSTYRVFTDKLHLYYSKDEYMLFSKSPENSR